ncbi:hypothetical protein PVK06_003108 [Gossypium arboreum]|uniref:Very-long-chain (3R)-3-hydroxyacyl-CoA dehydratase n=1 Tax=Gossypium arboreum TaxID=29729 RepID=A0ABR0R5M3_GOSAR|nr:hypothetical protein PVK06_003108 [Gossypium arboreum]
MSHLLKLYLFAYNSLQAFGWTISLFRILSCFIATKSVIGAYASAGDLICLLQTCAFLEVVHGAIGIVPSGVLFPMMQWGGRTHFLLAIVRRIHEVQELSAVFITFFAWSLTEVIRYSHYALNISGGCPSWLTYLRSGIFLPTRIDYGLTFILNFKLLTSFSGTLYSLCCILWALLRVKVSYICIHLCSGFVANLLLCNCFSILFLLSIVHFNAVWLMYQALPYIKEKNLYGDFFASVPFSYYNFVTVVLLIYPFLWLNLYLHLFKQRRSKLGKQHHKKKKI